MNLLLALNLSKMKKPIICLEGVNFVSRALPSRRQGIKVQIDMLMNRCIDYVTFHVTVAGKVS